MNIQDLHSKIGGTLGTSDWFKVDQNRVQAFADVTLDHQFIHLDADRTQNDTELGGTIAHGYLTLSLLTYLSGQVMPQLDDRRIVINYGLNRLRFLHPVPMGSRIRATLTLTKITKRKNDAYLVECDVRVDIEDIETPALMVSTLALYP